MELKDKIQIAVYKGIDSYSSEFVTSLNFDKSSEYVRQSEFLEVEFVPRKQSEVISEEIKSLDNKIDEIKSESLKELTELSDRKKELLAITVQR